MMDTAPGGPFELGDAATLHRAADEVRALIVAHRTDGPEPRWLDAAPAGEHSRRELFRLHGELASRLVRLQTCVALQQADMARHAELVRFVDAEVGRFIAVVNRNREAFLASIDRQYSAAHGREATWASLDATVAGYFAGLDRMVNSFAASMVRIVRARGPRRNETGVS